MRGSRNSSPLGPAAAAADEHDESAAAAARLLAIANYGPFSPSGLATCVGLARSDFDEEPSLGGIGREGGPISHDGKAASDHVRVSFSAGAGAAGAGAGGPTASGAQSFASGTAIALSGPHGIAILRSNKPHIPSVVLSHSTHTASGGSTGCGPLAFQPQSDDSGGGGRSTMLLATARGSGVLVWDASGRSLSPLLGRLGHDGRHPPAVVTSGSNAPPAPSTTAAFTPNNPSRPPKPTGKLPPSAPMPGSSNNSVVSSLPTPRPSTTVPSANNSTVATSSSWSYDVITSLCWLSAHSPTLVTTSARSASIWDLRCPSISRLRPSSRYELGAGGTDGGGFVSCAVAGDGSHEVAILDGGGVVRIYDTRMGGLHHQSKGQHTNSDHPLHAFYAHESSGVGISRLPLTSEGRRGWLTWGFDSYDSDGAVKVWREGCRGPDDSNEIVIDSDDYWSPRPEVAAAVDAAVDASAHDSRHFELTATFGSSSGGLSAARVVPHPYGNAVVAIGAGKDGGWQADYWTLSECQNASDEDLMITGGVFGAKLVGSFEGGKKCNDALRQVLGGSSDLGYLIQADLAVGAPSVQADHGVDSELLLCCLGSSGYLTTHVISEAAPTRRAMEASGSSGTLHSSPRRQVNSQRIVRTDIDFTSQQGRLYRPSSDPNLRRNFEDQRDMPSRLDGGHHVGGQGVMQASELSNMTPDDAYAYGRSSTLPVQDQDNIPEAVTSISRGVEGALFQFELDVAGDTAVAAAGVSGEGVVPTAKSPAGTADAIAKGNDVEPQGVVTASRTSTVDPFRAMNVPCPRLCGATFGRGGDGIIVFSNGDVRRQWNWFQTEQQSNRDESKQQLPSKPDHKDRRSKAGDNKSQQCPRTMLDLMRMNAAAKIAQWGVDEADDDSGQSDDESSVGSDESSSSSSSSSSGGSEEFESFFLQQTTSGGDDGYVEDDARHSSTSALTLANARGSRSSLFTAKEKNLSSKRSSTARKLSSGAGPDDAFVNPATDHLAPVVIFTQNCDFLVMNGQCPELADSMEFGPWGLASDEGMLRSLVSSTALSGSRVSLSSDGWGWIEEPDQKSAPRASPNEANKDTSRALLPSLSSMSRRFSMNPIRRDTSYTTRAKDEPASPLSPSKSFPIIQHALSETAPFPPPLTRIGGKEETLSSSMSGGFKSLFYSPSPDDIAVIPPDQNMLPLPRSRLRTPMRSSRESLTDTTNANNSVIGSDFLGVHMLAHVENISDFFLKQCELTVELCIYNAAVCLDLGQKGKADTWSLLAQTVEHMGRDLHNDFDGWGGPGGGALGKEIVAGILQYYELHGDVQMLATIVCALSGGVGRHSIVGDKDQPFWRGHNNSFVRNLLPDDDRRLDSYITRYASLLYQWGKITTRAELNKHLAQSRNDNSSNQVLGGEVLVPIAPGDEGRLQKDFVPPESSLHAPGVTFAPLCPRCRKPANPETNVCEDCRQYAFQCSICQNSIRGLFTTCLLCGHGGHVEHLLPWFEKETCCPTGCGCSCVLTTYTSEKVVAVGSDKAIHAPRIKSTGWQ